MTASVTAAALPIGLLVPRIGAPIVALVFGLTVSLVRPAGPQRPVLAAASRRTLQAAIVLLGSAISLQQVSAVGLSSIPVMVGTLTAGLLAAAVIGARLGITARLRTLIGVGTGICGASAIATVSGVISAEESETRYAITVIFIFNLVAVLTFPLIGHLLGMGQHSFGLWAGTAINDASSVLASGFAYGHQAGAYALIVKLTRTTMIIPISLTLAGAVRRRAGRAGRAGSPATETETATATAGLRHLVPWFLVWFLAAAALDSLGAFGTQTHALASDGGLLLTTVALAAVGLAGDLREMRAAGARPVALGASVWIVVAVGSLLLQTILPPG